MECQICFEEFNSTERRPKVLPCGHTSCLRCLKQQPESKCPVDRQDFSGPPEKLVDNFQLISNTSSRPRPKFWCCDCKKTASSKECMEWHTVCSLNKVHMEEATSLLVKLSSAVKGVDTQMQAEEKLRELLAKQGLQSERLHKRLKKAQENLQQSVDKRSELAEQVDEASKALAEADTAKVMYLVCGVDVVTVTLDTKVDPYLLHLKDQLGTYRLERTLRLSPPYTEKSAGAAFKRTDPFPFSMPELVATTATPRSTLPIPGSTPSPSTLTSSKSANATTTFGTAASSFGAPLSKTTTTFGSSVAAPQLSNAPIASSFCFGAPPLSTATTTSGTASIPSFGVPLLPKTTTTFGSSVAAPQLSNAPTASSSLGGPPLSTATTTFGTASIPSFGVPLLPKTTTTFGSSVAAPQLSNAPTASSLSFGGPPLSTATTTSGTASIPSFGAPLLPTCYEGMSTNKCPPPYGP